MSKLEIVAKAIAWKKSNAETATKLGLSLQEYLNLKQEVSRLKSEEDDSEDLVDEIKKGMYTTGYTEDLDRGIAEYKIQTSSEPKTAEEIEDLIKLDKTKWKLSKYSVWNGGKEDVWLTSAKVTAVISENNSVAQFEDFLKTYKPYSPNIKNTHKSSKKNGCFIINKQDAHLDKLSVNGDNDLEKRFNGFYENVNEILIDRSATTNLEKIIYILGGDEFNSEYTGTTTHGTPQTNLIGYHEGFERICKHEITVIDLLLQFTDNLEILYIPGNHDMYVGWHLVSWLSTYYRNVNKVKFDTRQIFTKYIKYNNTALCFNHGYVVKPETLAHNFPIEFREQWSNCNKYYIFCGDKHTELSKTIGGIKFYRLAQVSKAKSTWHDEKGYSLIQGELTTFFIHESKGLTGIDYQPM